MLRVKSNTELSTMNKMLLEKVKIEARIRSLQMADVKITQLFRNNNETPIDAVYHFHPEKRETTYAITIHIDDRDDYQTNISKENNRSIDIGSIPSNKECLITLVYSTQLNLINTFTIELVVPSFLIGNINTNAIQFSCNAELMNDSEQQRQIVRVQHTRENTYQITFSEENTLCLSSANRIPTNTVGQPFDYYCVLDFEAVCHQVNPRLTRPAPNDIWEIIEFPICLLESQSNTIIDIFHSYVRPTIQPKLNEKCIQITGITQDMVDRSPTFDFVWKDVLKFLSKHSLISSRSFTWITCGNWDLRTMLPLQLKQCAIDRPTFINEFINLKDLYNEYYPSARVRGMKDMLKHSRLILQGRHHSGLDDTKNIARLTQWFISNKKVLKLTSKNL